MINKSDLINYIKEKYFDSYTIIKKTFIFCLILDFIVLLLGIVFAVELYKLSDGIDYSSFYEGFVNG